MTSETSLTRRDALTAVAAVAASGLATSAVAQSATDDDRKAIAESYLKSLDAGGVSPTTGLGLFDHFSEDAEVFFPKWGVARGKAEVIQMFTDVGGTLKRIKHHYDGFTWYMNGIDSFAVEGTSEGEHRDGVDEPVLPVGVEGHDVLGARLGAGVADAGLQRGALAEVVGMPDDPRSRRFGDLGRAVGRAVIDAHDVLERGEQFADHAADDARLVEQGDDDPGGAVAARRRCAVGGGGGAGGHTGHSGRRR